MDEDNSTEQKTWQVYSFGKEMFLGYVWMSPGRVSVDRKGKVIPCWGTENRKGAGTNSEEGTCARNLVAESIRIFLPKQ